MTTPRAPLPFAALLAGAALLAACTPAAVPAPAPTATAPTVPSPDPSPAVDPSPSPTPAPPPTPTAHTRADASSVGQPWGTTVGLTAFRGNPTRTFYGRGPAPNSPQLAWRYPDRPLCGPSTAGGVTKTWCGTGWTGQPLIWERGDGVTEMIVGAYDHRVHFVDAYTGTPTRAPLVTGDIIKGTETLDPDGYPLLYVGSRDNLLRVVALDREPVEVLATIGPHPQRVWNNDWDANPLVVDGLLIAAGEDSWLHLVELNRSYDVDGLVTVAPDEVATVASFDAELFAQVGDRNTSIEASPAVFQDTVYIANSAGRVMGIDLATLRERGEVDVTFDFRAGDDIDATPVIDRHGMLYVAVEYERKTARAREVGQLVKLDPTRTGDAAIVWSLAIPPAPSGGDGGVWSTPALHVDTHGRQWLYVTTHPGELLVVDAATGEVVSRRTIGWHEWSSPVVVDGTLIVGHCAAGKLVGYTLADPASPAELWEVAVPTGGCVESTPAVWDGWLWVGSRDGHLYAFADPSAPSAR